MFLNLEHVYQDFKKYRKISNTLAYRLETLYDLAKGCAFYAPHLPRPMMSQFATKKQLSVRTLERWVQTYNEKGYRGLIPKKHKGKKRVKLHKSVTALIVEYRTLYHWGAEVIRAHLLLDYNIKLSLHVIYRYLKENGYIKRKRKRKIKNKHKKIVKVDTPGALTQTDVKHLPKLLRNKTYVYNFVDHASKWEFKMAFDSYNPWNTKLFFQEVVRHAPFPIMVSQTDNGLEFTFKWLVRAKEGHKNEFEKYLQENNIRHRLIPPGEKELNGLVERSHRTDDEELYHRIQPKDLKEFNKLLKEHCRWRNKERRKKPLNWQTTEEWLIEYQIKNEKKAQAA